MNAREMSLSHKAETIDGSVLFTPGASRPAPAKVELIEGSGPQFSHETQCVLQCRLRAAASILCFSFGLFLLRRLFVDTPLWGFHLGVVVFLASTVTALSFRCEYSLSKLRVLEAFVFGIPAIFLASHQYALMGQEFAKGEPLMVLAVIKSSVIYFFSVVVIYGMFIPNTWRRTAAVVFPLAFVPSAVALTFRFLNVQSGTTLGMPPMVTVEQISDNVLMLLVGAVLSTFGTHIINSLRVEAFAAKQLGQYRLKQLIGSGGMGKVYLAEHQLLKRPCAIKLIRPDKAADAQALLRFEREVKTTARLSHPNTIDIYDYGQTEDGVFFYVMEYLPGLDLEELVDRFGPLPSERVVYLLRQVCQALQEAHSIGFVHRDIKPGNIFVAQRGGMFDVAKVLDFGLVKPPVTQDDARLTREGGLAGSPLYMPPEQSSGVNEPDARSDIYSLGAVAFHLLTGRPPFEGRTPMEVIISHARDPVSLPSELVASVPEDLEQVIVKCLEKDPDDRFADVGSLDRALARCEVAGVWGQDQAVEWWRETGQEYGLDQSDAPELPIEAATAVRPVATRS